ncbi:uncharacterized protein LOC132734444 isoform X2 [Ruditapes philippinarum]|uniref:uncharacterized protein LOC132734444 isoform X2 n=1 Tax=Ruditapes philippinarum TaxID=129788 RepID=UPI00295B0522|nr:uncharacterized protein LOC132734444 isoform X2 [Ruditapes philippinarum]
MMYGLLGVLLVVTTVSTGSCNVGTIPLHKGSVMATSSDSYYEEGDILNRNCSALPRQKYIGWCPNPHDVGPKIQINLPGETAVHELVFQSTLASCPSATHNFATDAFLETFDLQYVLPGDNTNTLMMFGESLPALDGMSAEKSFKFDPPLVTRILTLTPKTHNIYPCFRFAVVGCSAANLCQPGFCMNGGKCAGENYCACAQGFAGDRCDMTAKDIKQQDYSFTDITNHKLNTPYAQFDVVGDVTLSQDRRRDHHHGHSCHFHSHHGHHSYCQYSHSNSHHDNGHHHGQSHCMHGLTNNHHGFTTSMHVQNGHNHNGHHYIYSNGGHLYGHHGSSLSYNSVHNSLHFHVSTTTHKWEVNIKVDLGTQQHHVSTSWHPHTGAHIHLNNHLVGSCGNPKPHSTPHTSTVPLRLGNGHIAVNLDINVILNMSISNLNMYPAPKPSLTKLGITGPLTPAPPTALPQQPTTTAPVSATSTHGTQPTPQRLTVHVTQAPVTTPSTPSTTVDQRPVCYTYANETSIGGSQSHTRCQTGEVCSLYEDGNKKYTAKCLEKSLCEAGKRFATPGKCWECCDTYLCNDKCSSNTSGPCVDEAQCAVMLKTGYDVCSNTLMAVQICSKTCKIC